MRSSTTLLVTLALSACALVAAAPVSRLRVTHRDLVPMCLDGRPVPAGTRGWDLEPGHVSLVFSMRVDPRPGQTVTEPGMAAIGFTAEANHRYEVEVRADPMAFSTRAWRAREWTPVVRDRTVDRIVSSDPQWVASPCHGVRHH